MLSAVYHYILNERREVAHVEHVEQDEIKDVDPLKERVQHGDTFPESFSTIPSNEHRFSIGTDALECEETVELGPAIVHGEDLECSTMSLINLAEKLEAASFEVRQLTLSFLKLFSFKTSPS
jgi:hypothetical protein